MQKNIFVFLSPQPACVQDYHFPPMEKKPFPLYLSHFPGMGAPKGGEAVGTLTATTTSQSFIVEGSEYLKDDDTWDYGEWPCAEIELSAAEGYRFSTPNRRTFSLSGCNVQYKSSEIDSDGSTLILQVYLSRIGGQLP